MQRNRYCFRLSADNQMRFHTVQKLIHNIDYVHANPTVQQLYTAMAKEFTGYGAVFEYAEIIQCQLYSSFKSSFFLIFSLFSKNVALMEELHKVLKNKSIDAKTWYKVCNTLTLPNMEYAFLLNPTYLEKRITFYLIFVNQGTNCHHNTYLRCLKLI